MTKLMCKVCRGAKDIRGMGGTTRKCYACKGIGVVEEAAEVSTISAVAESDEPETVEMLPAGASVVDLSATTSDIDVHPIVSEEPVISSTDTKSQAPSKKKARK